MVKVTAETIWIDQDANDSYRASNFIHRRWFNNLRQVILQNVFKRLAIPKQILDSFILSQQQKAQVSEQSVKDKFFFDTDYVNWKNIPRKTWSRHSAFLVHRQKANNLKRITTLETGAEIEPTVSKPPAVETRISFQVTLIRPLPVWATALNELSMIDSDLSSLRLMKVRKIQNIIIAEAA